MLLQWNGCLCFILLLIVCCECSANLKTKYKRKINTRNDVRSNKLPGEEKNNTDMERGRGFFLHSGLVSISKVLNFFPVGGERECQPSGYNVARAGICINAYDCRQRDGKAGGDCAQGLGVCCVFEVSCGGAVQNNLTYFMSPGFPELWSGDEDCNITIDKTHAGIMQLRIDFVHFTIGQPNRTTGLCDEDAMVLGDGDSKFTLCGQNHGQHIYYTLSSGSESREAGELAGGKTVRLSMRSRGGDAPRLWLLRLAQVPLAYSAPHGCLQYYTSTNGTIKTFNYAANGRHLADQDYKACVRRDIGQCSIRYVPCDERSFRIGPSGDTPYVIDPAEPELGPGGSGGPGTGFYGPDGAFVPGSITTVLPTTTDTAMEQIVAETQNVTEDQMMPVDNTQTEDDEGEGSGADPQIAPAPEETQPSTVSRIWSYIWSWMWGQSAGRSWNRWSPYTQHYASDDDKFRYFGYGNFGVGLMGYGRQRCQDRITIPCENEYFVSSNYFGQGVCDPHHCGNTFCPGQNYLQCRVETSITPFAVSVNFGPPTVKRSPEENIGMCLRYTQLPCDS